MNKLIVLLLKVYNVLHDKKLFNILSINNTFFFFWQNQSIILSFSLFAKEIGTNKLFVSQTCLLIKIFKISVNCLLNVIKGPKRKYIFC